VDEIIIRVIKDGSLEEESTTLETERADRPTKREPQRDENHPCSEIHAAEAVLPIIQSVGNP
jgi:hypothetical protein